MTPLVRKIFESTVQKATDMEVLSALDFEPDNSCEANHGKHPEVPCAGSASHWQESRGHKNPIKKVCINVVKFWHERYDSICQACLDQNGTPTLIGDCWSYTPIEK